MSRTAGCRVVAGVPIRTRAYEPQLYARSNDNLPQLDNQVPAPIFTLRGEATGLWGAGWPNGAPPPPCPPAAAGNTYLGDPAGGSDPCC